MKHPEDTPDPSGEPIPSDTSKDSAILSGILASMLLGVVGACTLVSIQPKRLSGATSSSRLKWEQRQTAIEQGIQHQIADKPARRLNPNTP